MLKFNKNDSWLFTKVKVRCQIIGYKITNLSEEQLNEGYAVLFEEEAKNWLLTTIGANIMIEQIKAHSTPEQLAVIEEHKAKEKLALVALRRWAKKGTEEDWAMIEGEVVVAKYVELIQKNLQEPKPEKVKPPKPMPKQEPKEEPKEEVKSKTKVAEDKPVAKEKAKPPTKKEVKKFKDKNQITFDLGI